MTAVIEIALPERLTQAEATACLQRLSQQIKAQPGVPVVVQAGALNEFDSAALAVLLSLRRLAQATGTPLQWQAVPERLRELVALYGLGELLPA